MSLRRTAPAIATVLFSIGILTAQERSETRPGGVLAIRGVTVIAMAEGAPRSNATVIVRGDRIDTIGPAASTAIPEGAVINVYLGSSLHDEMAILVRQVGMTPAESLDRATRRSARFLGLADSIGTIERGKIADLVLLDANPLADISNTRRIAAVIMGGRHFDRDALVKMHADVERAPDRRTDEWGRR